MTTITTTKPPKYRRQKSAGGRPDRAFVEVQGQRVYLGVWKSPESLTAYDRLVAQLRAANGALPVAAEQITVAELVLRFWRHADVYYRLPDGAPTSTIDNYRAALRPLVQLYSEMLVADFGPMRLRAVQRQMVDGGWSRRVVNQGINLVRGVFRWGVGQELVPGGVLEALRAVPPLRRGRSEAPDPGPVCPVPAAHIRAVRKHVSSQVWGMIELQRLTGMRPGEVCIMRGCDLDAGGRVWTYRPAHQKTAHHGHKRLIYLGPRAQTVLRPFLKRELAAHLFDPRDANRVQAQEKRRAFRARLESPKEFREGKKRDAENVQAEENAADREDRAKHDHASALAAESRRIHAEARPFIETATRRLDLMAVELAEYDGARASWATALANGARDLISDLDAQAP